MSDTAELRLALVEALKETNPAYLEETEGLYSVVIDAERATDIVLRVLGRES